MHSNVFSPVWRLYYNQKGGHFVRIGASCVELTPEHVMLIPSHCLCHLLGYGMALLNLVLTRPELQWNTPLPANMERVRQVIEERLAQALPNATLAKVAGLSVDALERAFKRHFGTTAARYVTKLRVREASR
jgi:hypothetical protein